MPVVPALRKLREENGSFKVSIDSRTSLRLAWDSHGARREWTPTGRLLTTI